MKLPVFFLSLLLLSAHGAAEDAPALTHLGTFDGVRFSGTKSLIASQVGTGGDVYTEEIDHLAMYEGTAQNPRLRKVWSAEADRANSVKELPRLSKLGRDLVGVVRECLNGTGGCSESLIRRTPEGWRDVELGKFMADWKARLPAVFENGFGKGIELDVAAQRATGLVYKKDDPNCCPSGRSVAAWSLEGNALKFLSAQTEEIREDEQP